MGKRSKAADETTDATRQAVQSDVEVAGVRDAEPPHEAPPHGDGTRPGDDPRTGAEPDAAPGLGGRYTIGVRVARAVQVRRRTRAHGEPLYRPLRIFALDPSASRLAGRDAEVRVYYEPLRPGPVGSLFEVDPSGDGHRWDPVDLESPDVLIRGGRRPSCGDPHFHQQMVYAVGMLVYDTFRTALGREVAWATRAPRSTSPLRLRLKPHAGIMRNAFYDPVRGEIRFGSFRADPEVEGRNAPQGWVHTALSHDIVTHELTHALLDGLRAHFATPTGPDALAFHEAFADCIAIFQRFSYRDVVKAELTRAGADGGRFHRLAEVGRQFGETTGGEGPLRDALSVDFDYRNAPEEPHERGKLLVAAVWDAFTTIYDRRIQRYVRLATGGSGILPPGDLPSTLLEILADEAADLAGQFLRILIRAVDYCPPVDVRFGEFLRAVLTADRDLVPDDTLAYREAWIDAFRTRRIYPEHVRTLSEDDLVWRPPRVDIGAVEDLRFGRLDFEGDPGRPSGLEEMGRQACALGEVVTDPSLRAEFGLVEPGASVDPPCIESIRPARRVGPDRQVAFDIVAEITQRRTVQGEAGRFDFLGGATVLLDAHGHVRYVVSKRVDHEERAAEQLAFMGSSVGRRFWTSEPDGRRAVRGNTFALLHGAG